MQNSGEIAIVISSALKGATVAGFLRLGQDQAWQVGAQVSRYSPQSSASGLTQMIDEVLAGVGANWDEVDRVIVDNGPGSFTGIKIGLAFAYGLAESRKTLPIVACSSLEAISKQWPNRWLFLPATRTQGYAAYSSEPGVCQLYSVSLESIVEDGRTGKIRLVAESGQGAKDIELDRKASMQAQLLLPWPKLDALLKEQGVALVDGPSLPSLMAMTVDAMLNEMPTLNGQEGHLQPLALPKARYLRKSAPEEMLERKKEQEV